MSDLEKVDPVAESANKSVKQLIESKNRELPSSNKIPPPPPPPPKPPQPTRK
jgi:hypothetical protein